jgi:hypothetical protein
MLGLRGLLARLLPHSIGVRWLGQGEARSDFKSFEEAQAEAERLNGHKFKKSGYFLHGHRDHDSKPQD